MANDVNTLEAVIGRNVRRLRGDRTQDDVAKAARRRRLPWSQTVISAIENGERELELGEILMLCKVLQAPPDELLAGEDEEWALVIPGMALQLGDARDILAGGRKFKKVLSRDLEQLARTDAAVAGMRDLAERARAVMAEDATRKAERQAARKFGTTPEHVVAAAYELWGQGLTAKRDSMVAAAHKDTSARAAQALRGHVSRQLLSELEERLPSIRMLSEAEMTKNYFELATFVSAIPEEG